MKDPARKYAAQTDAASLLDFLTARRLHTESPPTPSTAKQRNQTGALIYGAPSYFPRTFDSFENTFHRFIRDIVMHAGGDGTFYSDISKMEKILSDLRDIKRDRRGGGGGGTGGTGGTGGGGGGGGGGGSSGGGGGGNDQETFGAFLRKVLVNFCEAAAEIAAQMSEVIGVAWKKFWEGSGKEFARWTLALIFGYFGLPHPI